MLAVLKKAQSQVQERAVSEQARQVSARAREALGKVVASQKEEESLLAEQLLAEE